MSRLEGRPGSERICNKKDHHFTMPVNFIVAFIKMPFFVLILCKNNIMVDTNNSGNLSTHTFLTCLSLLLNETQNLQF